MSQVFLTLEETAGGPWGSVGLLNLSVRNHNSGEATYAVGACDLQTRDVMCCLPVARELCLLLEYIFPINILRWIEVLSIRTTEESLDDHRKSTN